MKNNDNSESLPKKVLPRTLKGNPNPKTEKKRSVSINAIETTSKGARLKANSKMEREDKHLKTTQSKIIQTEPQ